MNITAFMSLPDKDKEGYIQKCYPDKNGVFDMEYDFGVFHNVECEICEDGKLHAIAYGTTDSREPKFCPKHFVEISQETEFTKENL